jgi:hypothetical protein
MQTFLEYRKRIKEYLLESISNHDGDKYFDPTALDSARNPPPYNPNVRHPGLHPEYTKVIHMHPKDFLYVSRNGHNEEKQKVVEQLIASKTKFNEIPELYFTHNGAGDARVTGHEGRHRAKALLAAGATKMPVIFRSVATGEPTRINWKSHFEGEFPHTLNGERGHDEETNKHAGNHITFPTKDPRNNS